MVSRYPCSERYPKGQAEGLYRKTIWGRHGKIAAVAGYGNAYVRQRVVAKALPSGLLAIFLHLKVVVITLGDIYCLKWNYTRLKLFLVRMYDVSTFKSVLRSPKGSPKGVMGQSRDSSGMVALNVVNQAKWPRHQKEWLLSSGCWKHAWNFYWINMILWLDNAHMGRGH